jgi:hypothetical protein
VREPAGEHETPFARLEARPAIFKILWSPMHVWSYGVVLLEMAQGGWATYPELKGNRIVMSNIMSGHRTLKPVGCTDQLYAIMLYDMIVCSGST